MIALNARNGPNGIFVNRFAFPESNWIIPKNDPPIEPSTRLVQQPVIPVNAPMNANSSKSPVPIPSSPVNF